MVFVLTRTQTFYWFPRKAHRIAGTVGSPGRTMLEPFFRRMWRSQSTTFLQNSESERAKPNLSACQSGFGEHSCVAP